MLYHTAKNRTRNYTEIPGVRGILFESHVPLPCTKKYNLAVYSRPRCCIQGLVLYRGNQGENLKIIRLHRRNRQQFYTEKRSSINVVLLPFNKPVFRLCFQSVLPLLVSKSTSPEQKAIFVLPVSTLRLCISLTE